MYFHLFFFHVIYLCLNYKGIRTNLRAFAKQNQDKSLRKGRRSKQSDTSLPNKTLKDDHDNIPSIPSLADDNTPLVPSRSTVLQACTVTSGLICGLGVIVRQVTITSFLFRT